MDTQNLNIRTIKALRCIIGQIAEVVTGDIKFSLNDESSKVASVLGLKEVVNEAALIYELPDPYWQALLEAALPQAQEMIDEDDEFPDVEARELIDGLSEPEPESVDGKHIQHLINQAAAKLKLLMDSNEVEATLEKLAAKLEYKFGEHPDPNHWKEFVLEHRDEIMIRLMQEMDEELKVVREKLNCDTDAAEDEDGQVDVESQDDLEEMLSTGVVRLIERYDFGRRVENVLRGLAANVETVGELIEHEEDDVIKYSKAQD